MHEPRPAWKEPWLWFVAGLLGAALAASVVTIVIAERNADGPVVDRAGHEVPYKADRPQDSVPPVSNEN